jgi:hypothetical protein
MRFVASECTVDKPYKFNDRFFVVAGHEYIKNGEIWFPTDDESNREYVNHEYRTHFGFNFAHNGVIYRKSDNNMRLAMRRHTCAREPEIEGYDQQMRHNQRVWVASRDMDAIKHLLTQNDIIFDFPRTVAASAELLSKMPHSKLQLRQQAYRDLVTTSELGLDVWLRSCNWKFKPDEIARPGKYGRLIVDLGVSASLQGADWTSYIKEKINCREIHHRNCVFVFVGAPDPDLLTHYFDRLLHHDHLIYLICFSDDACISYKNSAGDNEIYNLDFSSCDSSQTQSIFTLMFRLFDCPKDVETALIGQIMSTIRVESYNKRHCVLLKPKEYYLQSGITATTLLNTTAWFACFLHFVDNYHPFLDVIKLCSDVGYTVTSDHCEMPEDIQFLKMSPTQSIDGQYYAVLNLGVILRASGVCRGDLPGKGPIAQRALDFQSGIMNGMLQPIINADLHHLNPKTTTELCDLSQVSNLFAHLKYKGLTPHEFTTEALTRRYRLSPDIELPEFVHSLRNAALFHTIYNTSVDKILNKDYSLNCPVE